MSADPTLERLAEHARAAGRIVFDTEFMTEGRYWPLLCLTQLGAQDPDGNTAVVLVDPLDNGPDPDPVFGPLADPQIEVVVHAGQQDLALLRRVWGVEINNVFDTQVAAAFIDSRAQRSYQDLVRDFVGVSLAKGESYTNWDRRPLTDDQLGYAREDVLHLPQLASALHERLEAAGRLQWALDESARLSVDPGERDPAEVFRKMTMSGKLNDRAAAIARELVFWREQTARDDDRPIKSVLPDPALMQLARRRPKHAKELRDLRGLNQGVSRRYGEQIIAAVRRGEKSEPIKLKRPDRLPDEAEPLIAIGQAVIRARCLDAKIAPQLLGTRSDLEQVARFVLAGGDEPGTALLEGWRRELVGQQLLDVLQGKRSIAIEPGSGRLGISS